MRGFANVITYLSLLVAVIALAMILFGCRSTELVPVETVRTEWRDRVREVHDTTTVSDTRFVYVKGDTVVDIRWYDRVREVYLYDTVLSVRTDSVPVPYPVEKRLTRWEQLKMDYSTYVILALTFGMVIVFWLVKKRSG